MNSIEYIKYPKCSTIYRIPKTEQLLKITCKESNQIFYNKRPPSHKKRNFRFIFLGVILLLVAPTLFNQNPISGSSIISKHKSNNWISISYAGLVDESIITHSGETIGDVIKKIPDYTDDIKGLVQPYLEPYSILCHDVLLAATKPDTLPLVNILNHYPIGSEQPAWVALFREGHFQMYYNTHLVRVFIKGSNPENSYEKYYSVIRNPIRDIINSNNINIDNIEIYTFKNNYENNEINLNTIPYIINKNDLMIPPSTKPDLPPRRKSLYLEGIKDFLEQNVVLEAIEVDENNDLYLYGRKDYKQTLAGKSVSLSDIAIIYRSIFHYGFNPPYISLDNHKDNRYAKVNFGGHIENTHTGSVVLEADKLFKTLSTGIDPNTHKLMKSKITKEVPDFLTEDERSLLEESGESHMQIRYWFYPDSIVIVTDSSIGVIQKHHFLADVERMDIKIKTGNAVRKTIDHLNQNFSQYERANNTFKELSTVGRIMALVNWLKGMNMNNRIELDELLSVKISAFTTPEITKKMLAVTAIAYPGNSHLTSRKIRDYTKVYYISYLLDKYSSSTSDKKFLEVAGNFFSQINISELAPPIYNKTVSEKKYYDHLIKSNETKINYLETEIDQKRSKLNKYNSVDVNNFNNLVDKYNSLLATQESYVDIYNSKVDKLNNLNIISRCISSIGGGINLSPTEFKIISENTNSPKLQEVISIKNKIQTVGKTSQYGNWVRSISGRGGSRINKIPVNSWKYSKSMNENIEYNYNSDSGDFTSVFINPNLENWQNKISVNGFTDYVKYSKNTNILQIVHSGFLNKCRANISSNGKRFVFYQ